ncbi:uncharacterized protein LOC129590143 [Paramacrobiotus metropolitanus]|uniref:uncharacterized protein LOC129590143 n=1 Tax=Paramacrobiotus metropolitanus TaxID=2943436 RepID=UPI0024462C88|nr:uncharacterized protein LOC129590143 [Paramacrobiotus metropolitanus]
MKKIILQRNKVLAQEDPSYFSAFASKSVDGLIGLCPFDGLYPKHPALTLCKNLSSPSSSTTEEIPSKEIESLFFDCKPSSPAEDTESCRSLFSSEQSLSKCTENSSQIPLSSITSLSPPSSPNEKPFADQIKAASSSSSIDWATHFKRADFGPEYGFRPRRKLLKYSSQKKGWSKLRLTKMQQDKHMNETKEKKRPGRKPGRKPKIPLPEKPVKKPRAKVDDAINCICMCCWDIGPQIECEQCGKWQHIMCVGVSDNDTDGYKCHVCDASRKLPLADSEEAYRAFTAYAMSLPVDGNEASSSTAVESSKTDSPAQPIPPEPLRKRGWKRKQAPDKHVEEVKLPRTPEQKKSEASVKRLLKHPRLFSEPEKIESPTKMQPPLNSVRTSGGHSVDGGVKKCAVGKPALRKSDGRTDREAVIRHGSSKLDQLLLTKRNKENDENTSTTQAAAIPPLS